MSQVALYLLGGLGVGVLHKGLEALALLKGGDLLDQPNAENTRCSVSSVIITSGCAAGRLHVSIDAMHQCCAVQDMLGMQTGPCSA